MHLEKKQCDLSSLERLILTLPHIYPVHCVTQGGQREKTNTKKTPKHQKTTKNPLELSVTMGKSIMKAVFNKLSVLLQFFPTRSISITAHFLFTIPRESL